MGRERIPNRWAMSGPLSRPEELTEEAPVARSNALVREAAASPVSRGPAGERCDCCCAPAVVHVVVRSGLDLVFCGHHARENALQLRRSGALIRVDGRVASLFW